MAKGSGGSGGSGGGGGFRRWSKAQKERDSALRTLTEVRNSRPSPRARAIGSRPTAAAEAAYDNRVREYNRTLSAANRRFKKADATARGLFRPEYLSRA